MAGTNKGGSAWGSQFSPVKGNSVAGGGGAGGGSAGAGMCARALNFFECCRLSIAQQ